MIDSRTVHLKRRIAEALAPAPSTLGHPLFSERIEDRKRRWQIERQPNSYAAVAGKTNGQAYMRALGHAVPEVYGVYPTLDAIPRFEDLPASFVLKPSSGWSATGVFLIHRGLDLLRQRRFTREQFLHEARSLRGGAAAAIAGSWVAEELLFDYAYPSEAAMDYKFFCFGPKVAMIQINRRSGMKRPFVWFMDSAWKPLPLRMSWDKYQERSLLPRPPCLDEMLQIVADVGGRLNIFVRIDMYATTRGPVFGEFTAYPHGGRNYTPRGDAWLGSLWKTPDGGV
jgi:hypothetical protein